MNDREEQFMDKWLDRNIKTSRAKHPEPLLAKALAKRCIADAEKEGMTREALEEVVVDLEQAISDELNLPSSSRRNDHSLSVAGARRRTLGRVTAAAAAIYGTLTRRHDMPKIALALMAIGLLAGCTNAETGAVAGGVGGAALGTLAGGNDARNAIVGGAVGAVAGTLIGAAADRQGYCRYRDQHGRIYEDRC